LCAGGYPTPGNRTLASVGEGDTRTVLLGFLREDSYDRCSVFSCAVKLKCKRHTRGGHPPTELIIYSTLALDEAYVVRLRFIMGRKIVAFCDVHILHSAPDIAYQTSIMRFM
jgi:hypothetical protein